MKRLRIVLGLLMLCPATALAQPVAPDAAAAQPASLSKPDRFNDFVHAAVLSPGPYALAFGGGVLDELGGMPEEWIGGGGFTKRTLARAGSGFASDAIGHSAAALLGHHVRYEPCSCSGGWQRTGHALSRGFLTRNDQGSTVIHSSLFIAKLGAAGLANAWYPKSYTGSDIVREGIAGIGVNAALNIAREFGPELMRLIPFR